VLSAAYGVPRDEIVTIVHRLLHARQLSFRAPDVLADAVDAFARGKSDLADYLIREDARAAGAINHGDVCQIVAQGSGLFEGRVVRCE
jgi:predicted nucleic-acid-binding protein